MNVDDEAYLKKCRARMASCACRRSPLLEDHGDGAWGVFCPRNTCWFGPRALGPGEAVTRWNAVMGIRA